MIQKKGTQVGDHFLVPKEVSLKQENDPFDGDYIEEEYIDFCDEEIESNEKSVKNEMVEDSNLDPKDLECDECGKQCKNLKHFNNHKRYHKSLSGPQEWCEKCERNIPEKFFPSHCITVHPDDYIQAIFLKI